MIPILIDCAIPHAHTGEGATSLLALPLGEGTYLDYLAALLTSSRHQELFVLTTLGTESDYAEGICAASSRDVRVVDTEELFAAVCSYEPSDTAVVADVARWPIGSFDTSSVFGDHYGYGGFVHAIAVGSEPEAVREQVECDGRGNVTRIRRLYDRVNWPEVAVTGNFLSFGPIRALNGICFEHMSELRGALASRGVLCRDYPIALDAADLSQESGFLALSEYVARESELGGVRAGRGCRIDPSARLVGSVCLHPGVSVARDVTIVGPTAVGSGSRIGAGSMIAQSVLAAGTEVGESATIRQRLVRGKWSASNVDGEEAVSRLAVPIIGPIGEASMETRADSAAPALDVRRQVHLGIKRLLDAVLSAAALLVLSPLLAVVSILIKLDSPGPVLFRHRRERRGGKEFSCYKFRTMVADAHGRQRALYRRNEVDGPQFMMRKDPRVTRVGRWIRVTNIDELPQLINVLLGHMSLVGPRPSPFRENQICVPWRRARLSVRPGITGLWQLCREHRRGADFHQWIYYDMLYVRRFSIWLDIRILLATVVTLGGRRTVPLSRLIRTEFADVGSAARPVSA